MINVEQLFLTIKDIRRKNQAGYLSSDEFNRMLDMAQDVLMRFFYVQFERHNKLVDSLNPFIQQIELPVVDGFADFPSDYRHRLEGGAVWIENVSENCKVLPPLKTILPCPYLMMNEVLDNEDNDIRRSSFAKRRFYHSYVNNKIIVYPNDINGKFYLKYIKQPSKGKYATTIDPNTDKEVFDASASENLDWNPQDFDNIVDIMLLYSGIATRENALISWVSAKKNITGNA